MFVCLESTVGRRERGEGGGGGGVRHGCFSYHFCEILDQSEYERRVDH